MTSGDRGVVIVVTLSTADFPYTVPAGSTGVAIAAPGTLASYGTEEQIGPVTFSPDGSTAFYVTQGNGLDYQSGGNWITKVQITQPSGQQYTSPPGQFYVFPQ
jgi:hypothetical protein